MPALPVRAKLFIVAELTTAWLLLWVCSGAMEVRGRRHFIFLLVFLLPPEQ